MNRVNCRNDPDVMTAVLISSWVLLLLLLYKDVHQIIYHGNITAITANTFGFCLTGQLFCSSILQVGWVPDRSSMHNLWGLLVRDFCTCQMPFMSPIQQSKKYQRKTIFVIN